jgi:carbon-monoxide dehydrogenase large subunit
MSVRYFGAKVFRSEDPRLVTGHGRYVDDIDLPGMLYAAFVRSEHAHARIKSIDTSAAKAVPGVHAVMTAEDLGSPLTAHQAADPADGTGDLRGQLRRPDGCACGR